MELRQFIYKGKNNLKQIDSMKWKVRKINYQLINATIIV